MTAPNETASAAQSSYNAQEIATLNSRLQTIEQLLELDPAYAGLNIQWKSTAVQAGLNAQVETLVAASPAAKPLVPQTNLKGLANAVAATLAVPPQDGLWKMFVLTDATHACTLAGTHIFGNTAKTGTFTNVGDWCILHSLKGLWVLVAGSAVWA